MTDTVGSSTPQPPASPEPPPEKRSPTDPLDRRQRLLARPPLEQVRTHVTRDNARFVLISILPVAVSLVSFVLSIYSIHAANQAPAVVMTMPVRVRLAQSGTTPWLYLQAQFVNTSANNRNETIQNLSVEVVPVSGGTPVPFVWDEEGTWLYDTKTFRLDWQFVADPAPIVVGPNDPQFRSFPFHVRSRSNA